MQCFQDVSRNRRRTLATKMPVDPIEEFRAGAAPFPYVYRWDRQGRKGQPCNVTARGKMNSCRVVFADGYQMITSRNAIRRAVPSVPAR